MIEYIIYTITKDGDVIFVLPVIKEQVPVINNGGFTDYYYLLGNFRYTVLNHSIKKKLTKHIVYEIYNLFHINKYRSPVVYTGYYDTDNEFFRGIKLEHLSSWRLKETLSKSTIGDIYRYKIE